MPWLMREGEVVASVEVRSRHGDRATGLINRDRDEVRGAMVLRPCRQVHTFGVRFPIDVAFCDHSGVILRIDTLPRRRLSRVVARSAFVVEAPAGAFERWGLREGDTVEIKE